MLMPIAFTLCSPRRSRSTITSCAHCLKVNVPDGFVDRPCPRRSGTMTRQPLGSSGKTCFQSAPIPIPPCRRSSGSPSPRPSKYIWNPFTSMVGMRRSLARRRGLDATGSTIEGPVTAWFPATIDDLQSRLLDRAYVADRGLAVSLFLALKLRRPLFLEGEAGVGKTALAAAVAGVLDTDLIRLQCYEGH